MIKFFLLAGSFLWVVFCTISLFTRYIYDPVRDKIDWVLVYTTSIPVQEAERIFVACQLLMLALYLIACMSYVWGMLKLVNWLHRRPTLKSISSEFD